MSNQPRAHAVCGCAAVRGSAGCSRDGAGAQWKNEQLKPRAPTDPKVKS